MKILTIAGHQNIKYNSLTSLHGSTGTAGELEINIRITDRVSAMLRERGFEVTQSDANANDDPTITSTDYSLALALHCDMDVPGDQGGGMCGSGDKSVDNSWEESLRIKKVFDEVYFPEVKIVNKNFVTPGMSKYYIWQYLTPKTPCVLLEMGQAKDPHDSVLLANTDLIAGGIVRSICKALNVPYDLAPPVNCEELLAAKDEQIRTLNEQITVFKTNTSLLEKKITDLEAINETNQGLMASWQKQLKTANVQLASQTEQLALVTEDRNKYRRLYEGLLSSNTNTMTGWQLIKLGISKLKIKK